MCCCLNKRVKRRVIADRTSKKFKHAAKIVGLSVLDLGPLILCLPVVAKPMTLVATNSHSEPLVHCCLLGFVGEQKFVRHWFAIMASISSISRGVP